MILISGEFCVYFKIPDIQISFVLNQKIKGMHESEITNFYKLFTHKNLRLWKSKSLLILPLPANDG